MWKSRPDFIKGICLFLLYCTLLEDKLKLEILFPIWYGIFLINYKNALTIHMLLGKNFLKNYRFISLTNKQWHKWNISPIPNELTLWPSLHCFVFVLRLEFLTTARFQGHGVSGMHQKLVTSTTFIHLCAVLPNYKINRKNIFRALMYFFFRVGYITVCQQSIQHIN